jgi:hypothetical protein
MPSGRAHFLRDHIADFVVAAFEDGKNALEKRKTLVPRCFGKGDESGSGRSNRLFGVRSRAHGNRQERLFGRRVDDVERCLTDRINPRSVDIEFSCIFHSHLRCPIVPRGLRSASVRSANHIGNSLGNHDRRYVRIGTGNGRH